MLRRLTLWGILAIIVGGLVYGYLYFAVVGLYEPSTPKVSYLIFIKKPERSSTFFFNHVDKKDTEKERYLLEYRHQPVPWHLDYDWVINHAIYTLTLDNRAMSD